MTAEIPSSNEFVSQAADAAGRADVPPWKRDRDIERQVKADAEATRLAKQAEMLAKPGMFDQGFRGGLASADAPEQIVDNRIAGDEVTPTSEALTSGEGRPATVHIGTASTKSEKHPDQAAAEAREEAQRAQRIAETANDNFAD